MGLGYLSRTGCICVATPHRVPNLRNIRSVSASSTMLALSWTGKVFSWGPGGNGVLGVNRIPSTKCRCLDHPVKVYGIRDAVAASVGNFGGIALALLKGGRVMSWGSSYLATKSKLNLACSCADRPVPVYGLRDVKSISPGYVSLAVTNQGSLMAWGPDYLGALGTGKFVNDAPFPVKILSGKRFLAASSGGGPNAAALTIHHRVFTWGGCEAGEIGNGTSCGGGRGDPMPEVVCDHVSHFTTGFDHTVVLRLPGSTAGGCRARITNPQD